MNRIWIFSTVAIGTATIIFAYFFIKKRKTPVPSETLPAPENELDEEDFQNKSSAEEELPESESEYETYENLLKLLGIPAEKDPRYSQNSIKGDYLYLQPLKSTKRWDIAGKVHRLYTYPLEGGGKHRLTKIHCSNIGSSELGFSSFLRDRCFIVYSVNPISNIKKALLDDPKLRAITISESEGAIFMDSPDINRRIRLDPFKIFRGGGTDVCYEDGTIINVQDCGDEVSEFLTTVIPNYYENMPRFLRMGMYTSKPRGLKHHIQGQNLTGKEKKKHSLEALSPTYSACTIVNEASVNSLRNEIGKSDLTHDYFRPHIVITGQLPEYAEDKIRAIRVGQAVLTNKLPCIQTMNVSTNPITGNLTLDEEPYRTLSKIRPLANTFSKYNSNKPIFGINMKVLSEGKISEGDNVYVQWDGDSPMQ